ncbi:MAG: ATP-binding protein [Bradyrhizobiaceae bacterium]|nr:ATP-binding protein [Bradyrhizobiaceae bacterium]
MNRHELREIIAGGESSTVEFKRKYTSIEKFAREIIAFANTDGGVLLVGVDDDGKIVGVESEKELQEVVAITQHSIVPWLQLDMEVVEIDFRDVVVIRVPRSATKPHRYVSTNSNDEALDKKAFIRNGEQSVEASREMVKVLEGQSPHAPPITLSIGDRERRLFTYLERYGKASVNDFARLVNISRRRASQILVRLVRAGVLHIHNDGAHDFFTLV